MTIIAIIKVTDMVQQMCKSSTYYNLLLYKTVDGTRGINYEDDQTDVVLIYVKMYIWTLEPEELEEFASKVRAYCVPELCWIPAVRYIFSDDA